VSERLTHVTEGGDVRMVDVSAKPDTERVAEAEAIVVMSPETRQKLFASDLPKGDALAAARVAGIMAAKRTPELIPLCHPLRISAVNVEITPIDEGARVLGRVKTTGPTGVEMEAMTAAAVAALTLYDMVKGVERGVEIRTVRLLLKSGGRSGTWKR
jgi:cyclic pyranopterin phosphate synthase